MSLHGSFEELNCIPLCGYTQLCYRFISCLHPCCYLNRSLTNERNRWFMLWLGSGMSPKVQMGGGGAFKRWHLGGLKSLQDLPLNGQHLSPTLSLRIRTHCLTPVPITHGHSAGQGHSCHLLAFASLSPVPPKPGTLGPDMPRDTDDCETDLNCQALPWSALSLAWRLSCPHGNTAFSLGLWISNFCHQVRVLYASSLAKFQIPVSSLRCSLSNHQHS